MNKQEKQVEQAQLNKEKQVLRELKAMYQEAVDSIGEKVQLLQLDPLSQSKAYQAEFQKVLKSQIATFLDLLHDKEYDTIEEFLKDSYTNGFVGALYSIQAQGIPLILPIAQEQVVKAIQLDSKIKVGLYQHLGNDIKALKKTIRTEVARGISQNMGYSDIARNISNVSNTGLNNAMRIARTESHRVKGQAAYNAANESKKKGADVLKQWDSSMDGATRPSHRAVDGEIRELEETFSNGLRYPGDPRGKAGEVINCRCVALTRAKWALDEDELNTLKERAEYYGLDKSEQFEDYKKKYLKAAEAERVRVSVQKRNDEDTDDEADVITRIKNKVINTKNTHNPIRFYDLNSEYMQELQGVIDNAQGLVKDVFDKYKNDVYFINEKWIGTAKTSNKGIAVNFEKDSDDERGKWVTTFHEIGHAIDRASSRVSSKNTAFGKHLKEDFESVVKNYELAYNISRSEAYKEIGSSLREPMYHSISDLVGGITDNKCVGRYKHSIDYWNKPHKLEKEAFAHFFEATVRNDIDKLSAIKSVFPNAYADFEDMLRSII